MTISPQHLAIQSQQEGSRIVAFLATITNANATDRTPAAKTRYRAALDASLPPFRGRFCSIRPLFVDQTTHLITHYLAISIVCSHQTMVCSHQTMVCPHQTMVCCRQTKQQGRYRSKKAGIASQPSARKAVKTDDRLLFLSAGLPTSRGRHAHTARADSACRKATIRHGALHPKSAKGKNTRKPAAHCMKILYLRGKYVF